MGDPAEGDPAEGDPAEDEVVDDDPAEDEVVEGGRTSPHPATVAATTTVTDARHSQARPTRHP